MAARELKVDGQVTVADVEISGTALFFSYHSFSFVVSVSYFGRLSFGVQSLSTV